MQILQNKDNHNPFSEIDVFIQFFSPFALLPTLILLLQSNTSKAKLINKYMYKYTKRRKYTNKYINK